MFATISIFVFQMHRKCWCFMSRCCGNFKSLQTKSIQINPNQIKEREPFIRIYIYLGHIDTALHQEYLYDVHMDFLRINRKVHFFS